MWRGELLALSEAEAVKLLCFENRKCVAEVTGNYGHLCRLLEGGRIRVEEA
jgi:hypothetical protein